MSPRDIAVELFEIRGRGLLAHMFQTSQTDPSEEQWEMLRGTREITLRDIAEIAFHLDFEVEFLSQPRERGDEE